MTDPARTLRDDFAEAALRAVVWLPGSETPDADRERMYADVADSCYRMADAMLARREAPPAGPRRA